ncbi:zinc-binding alcohol dehydrogenase family protein [Streptomyces sp. NPDC005728]|uniref:quinone oxidoreductase family protein n=1 Tax=Streptomyces sp. NPDC005728 TaxID=3157054 RepID=UPI0033E8F4AA
MSEVWAAGIHKLGEAPRPTAVPAPAPTADTVPIEVHAAGFNPVDKLITSGNWYGGNPPLPSIPGREAVGVVQADRGEWKAGDRVYFRMPANAPGTMAQTVNAAIASLIRAPSDLDSTTAAAIGFAGTTASLALLERGGLVPAETVVVLGSTGAVGRCAVHVALEHGARRVIAVSRTGSEDFGAALLDAGRVVPVTLPGADGVPGLDERILEAAGAPVDLVVDLLWGAPAGAALSTLGAGGRLVNVGASAGAELILRSETMRSKPAEIRGHTNAQYSPATFNTHCKSIFELASQGGLSLPTVVYKLEDVAEAWHRMDRSPRAKTVVTFEH